MIWREGIVDDDTKTLDRVYNLPQGSFKLFVTDGPSAMGWLNPDGTYEHFIRDRSDQPWRACSIWEPKDG